MKEGGGWGGAWKGGCGILCYLPASGRSDWRLREASSKARKCSVSGDLIDVALRACRYLCEILTLLRQPTGTTTFEHTAPKNSDMTCSVQEQRLWLIVHE